MNLFRLHPEKRIGYKRLSDADLGLSNKSHQTHFGLFDDILTFLPNSIEIPDAIFLYEDQHVRVDVSFDRIKNPDGTYRSPKIKKGLSSKTSLLSLIREHAQNTSTDTSWFLFWFGLENEQPVFYLVRSGSEDYIALLKNGIDLSSNVRRGRLTECDYQFDSLLDLLETKINIMRKDEAKELELEILSGASPDFTKYRALDYAAAKKQCEETGRKGEELVDQYFKNLELDGAISSYKWMNEQKESYCPYDFEYILKPGDKKIFVEVKTTGYTFDQQMIFSGQEIYFGSSNLDCYDIFRIYRADNGQYYLRICDDVQSLFRSLNNQVLVFKDKTVPYAAVESIKLAVKPDNDKLDFGKEQRLIYSLD